MEVVERRFATQIGILAQDALRRGTNGWAESQAFWLPDSGGNARVVPGMLQTSVALSPMDGPDRGTDTKEIELFSLLWGRSKLVYDPRDSYGNHALPEKATARRARWLKDGRTIDVIEYRAVVGETNGSYVVIKMLLRMSDVCEV